MLLVTKPFNILQDNKTITFMIPSLLSKTKISPHLHSSTAECLNPNHFCKRSYILLENQLTPREVCWKTALLPWHLSLLYFQVSYNFLLTFKVFYLKLWWLILRVFLCVWAWMGLLNISLFTIFLNSLTRHDILD